MLKLTSPSDEPAWRDLIPDVRLRVRPPTPAAMIVARAEAGKLFRAEGADADPDVGAKAAVALVRSLAQFAIVEWTGIGDEAGEAAAVTPENIDALLRVWPAYDAFDRLYVVPALAGETEKNASSPSPNGTSAAA